MDFGKVARGEQGAPTARSTGTRLIYIGHLVSLKNLKYNENYDLGLRQVCGNVLPTLASGPNLLAEVALSQTLSGSVQSVCPQCPNSA